MEKQWTYHAFFGEWTVIRIDTVNGWYANIFRIKGDTVDSHIKQGRGIPHLTYELAQFGAPTNLIWLPGGLEE